MLWINLPSFIHSLLNNPEYNVRCDVFSYDLAPDMKCETDHAACTDLIVQFTIDHARLPITHMSSASFHMSNR